MYHGYLVGWWARNELCQNTLITVSYRLVMEEIFVILSAILLQSFKSICTDRELATYIKIAVIHFIYNLLIYLPIVKCSCSLFISCNNCKPIMTFLQNFQRIKAKMHSTIVAIYYSKGILNSKQTTYRLYNTFILQ